MEWFGPASWGAVVNQECARTTTPTAPCVLCGVAFTERDHGLVLPYASTRDGPLTVPYHLRCLLASVGVPLESYDAP